LELRYGTYVNPTVEIVLNLAIGALVVVGLILVVRDTVRRSGRWGINFTRIVCPHCGVHAGPGRIRMPRNADQALWGGRTCERCGCHLDKWGREIAQR
jgi:hypothetical protein